MQTPSTRKIKFDPRRVVDLLGFCGFPLLYFCHVAEPRAGALWTGVLVLLVTGVILYFCAEDRKPSHASHPQSSAKEGAAATAVRVRITDLLPVLVLPGGFLAWVLHLLWAHQEISTRSLIVLIVAMPFAVVAALVGQALYWKRRFGKTEPEGEGWLLGGVAGLLCLALLLFVVCVGCLFYRIREARPAETPPPPTRQVLPEAPQ